MLTVVQRLALAVQHHGAGRRREAEALYRGILDEVPQHPHALHLLGVLAHQAGRHQEAIDLITRALAVQGPHPAFHSNLAAVYLITGQLALAAAHCREAIRLQPDLADAHNNLGVALRRLGQLDEAERACRAAIRLNPNHLDAQTNLGAVLQKQGRVPEALAHLRELARRAPGHAQAQNDLGGALLASNEPAEAVVHFREAILIQPAFAEAYGNLGLALRDLNRLDEAMACYREALRINPNYSLARTNLGYAYKSLGKIDEAWAEFLETLRLEPNNAMALASLSKLAETGRHPLAPDHVHKLQALLERQDLLPDERCQLHYALASVFDRAGDNAAAFAHCNRANQLRKEFVARRGIVYDPPAQHELVDRIMAAFTPAYFERVSSFGLSSEVPVFIVGMPRSGTTLAEQILASHPRVFGAGELRDLHKLTTTFLQSDHGDKGYTERIANLDRDKAHALAEAYLQRLRELAPRADRVIDKMPFNYLDLGIIATLFPRGRIIHCRRGPVDTCVSSFFQNFGDPLAFTLDLRHLGHYYREYERLMAHWARVLPVPIFELRYEDLTADQEAVSRRLVAFCGLDWDERCLRFNDTERVVRTASVLQVRQPMYRSSVGRWQRYEAHLQPLHEALRRLT